MNEKRFEIRTNINGEHWLFDNRYDKAMMISKIQATLLDVCNMLNEQQTTISALKEENEQLRQKANSLQTSLNYWQNSYKEVLEKIPPKIREIWVD